MLSGTQCSLSGTGEREGDETVLTYQDLEIIRSEQERMNFVQKCVDEHKGSFKYNSAVNAQRYYDGQNPTIEKYEKIIYDAQGKAHIDMWTPNHKISTHFFTFAADQIINYLLSNGVSIDTDRLSPEFVYDLQFGALQAYITGCSFLYPELQRHQMGEVGKYRAAVFDMTNFAPIFDENTGMLRAGVRFWGIEGKSSLRFTLFEESGFTEYVKRDKEQIEAMGAKQPYRTVSYTTDIDGTDVRPGEAFPGFPIVPLRNNKKMLSELVGRRNTIDALDLITSGMVNNTDEGTLMYWVLQNYGGMDALEDAKFLDELRKTRVLHVNGMDSKAEPHTLEQPVDTSQTTIDMLTKRLYTDFQIFDASAVSAGNQTATAIKASYVPMDLRADKMEREITLCLLEFLRLIGVTGVVPTFTRNQLVNKQEEVQSILMTAQYLSDDYITEKVLTVMGDVDRLDEVLTGRTRDDASKFEDLQSEEDVI